MISTQEEYILRACNLEGKQVSHYLDAVEASVDIVAKKEHLAVLATLSLGFL